MGKSIRSVAFGLSIAGLGMAWACATGTSDDAVGALDSGGIANADAGRDQGSVVTDAAPSPTDDASQDASPAEDSAPPAQDATPPPGEDGAAPEDAGQDAGEADAGEHDAGHDGGHDAGEPDAGEADAGHDAGEPDAGEPDAGVADAGEPDAGHDAGGAPDAGCVAADVVINEVQTAGSGGAEDEWVELYNPSSCAISIAGWALKHESINGTTASTVWTAAAGTTLPAGGYGVVAGTAYTASATPIGAFNTGVLAPDGGGLGLYDATATLVNAMGYGAGATNAYVQGSPATAPASAESAARTPNGANTHDDGADFAVATSPTPGARN